MKKKRERGQFTPLLTAFCFQNPENLDRCPPNQTGQIQS